MLQEGVEDQIKDIEATLLVGIPSYNNEKTIGHVANAVSVGLKKYFPSDSAIIINSDGNSQDNTREEFLKNVKYFPRLTTKYLGYPGKGSAIRTIFEIASKLDSKAIVIVDSDLRNITPYWIYQLIKPIKDGFDLVTPYYARHKYDATLTNNICFPVVYGVFGQDIRQPIGGDFGISQQIVHFLLKKEWPKNVCQYGIDIFLTTIAICEGFKISQAFLGAKIHDPKDPYELTPMFRQVVTTLFQQILRYSNTLGTITKVSKLKLFGKSIIEEPPPISICLERIENVFRQGVKKYRAKYEEIFSPEVLAVIDKEIDPKIWAHIVYEYILAYKERGIDVEMLMPLWFGRVASFVHDTLDMNDKEAEKAVLSQAKTFFKYRSLIF